MSLLLGFALLCGVIVGLGTALAGDSLLLLGLWPLAAALAGGFLLVGAAHLLRQRSARVHLAVAALFAMAWLSADRAGEAWLFRLHQIGEVGAAGLLLADHAVLHDTDHPDALVDAALLAETGAAGTLGAARVQLRGGVPVLRVLRSTRVVRTPIGGHVLWLALRAALVALLVARALEQLRGDPVCGECGEWLQRRELGWLDEQTAAEVAEAWSRGDRITPPAVVRKPRKPGLPATSGAPPEQILVLEDKCPHDHSGAPGFELRRPRGRALARRQPGPVASLAPLLHTRVGLKRRDTGGS